MSTRSWAIGLMTGTVLDGNIDVALLRTDGERIAEFGPWQLVPYAAGVLPLLEEAVQAARDWNFSGSEPAVFDTATRALSLAQTEAVRAVLVDKGIPLVDVSVIGFHGQTVLHRAPRDGKQGQTRQLADGRLMAKALGCDVVSDFRSNDMAHGGQGAPLSAVYHRALMGVISATSGTAFVNLGGIGNLTWVDHEALIAFDTGPANAPLNDWIRTHTGRRMDTDGLIASAGEVDESRLTDWLADPWFSAPFPKSLDRFDFPADMVNGLSLADGAATLTAFAAASVAQALTLLPGSVDTLIIGGGGRRNPALMRMLGERSGIAVTPAEAHGLRGDAIEAEAFAFLAERSRRGLPLGYPGTTGVPKPTSGGVLFTAPPG